MEVPFSEGKPCLPPGGIKKRVIVASAPLECRFCTVYKRYAAGIFVGICHHIQT
jgi:hypothetical protein